MKSKKILIITSNYLPNASANGICVSKIAENLASQGYEVDLVALHNSNKPSQFEINDVKIHTVKKNMISKKNKLDKKRKYYLFMARFFSIIKNLIYYPINPITSMSMIFRLYNQSKILMKDENFDMVISVYSPIETALAGLLLKRKNPNIKFLLYILDSLPNGVSTRILSKEFIERQGRRWEKLLYSYADKIVLMKSHQKYYEKNEFFYSPYSEKMVYSDIPLLVNKNLNAPLNREKNSAMKFLYAGTLCCQMRNPRYFCEIITNIKNLNVASNFYSKSTCDRMLQQYALDNPGIVNVHGLIPHESLSEKIEAADFLVNIGNKNTDMVPSKIFEYMSTGKPIIHFYHNDSDSSLPYLKKYPNSLLIEMNDNIFVKNVRNFEYFIVDNLETVCPFDQVSKNFAMNTPDYTSGLISDLLT